MYEKLFLILMIIFAFTSIQTPKLISAIIYLGMFSFLSSIIFLIYQSPNIALAEAIIGSTLSTIIYLVALKKQKNFEVYVTSSIDYELINDIESFCEKDDLHFHYTRCDEEDVASIIKSPNFDLLIFGKQNDIHFLVKDKSYKVEKLINILAKDIKNNYNLSLHILEKSESEIENDISY